ncbi:MAG: hypothetical protein MZW92_37615 [Comamonadaceae bacterium]|nr:hypothetical protein [Comamonadaceae bacterium]
MRTITILTACCIPLLPLYAQAAQHEPLLVQQMEKPASIRPVKAKPAKKPKATSSKDKLSATGYGEDPGEETQERPNPLNRQGLERTEPVKSPVR